MRGGANHNFEIEKNANFSKLLTITDPNNSDAPVDLTGYTAEMDIRETPESSTVLLELSTANGKIVINGPTGEISLGLLAADTAALTWEHGTYDLILTSPGGFNEIPIYGEITVTPTNTR